MPRDKFMIAYQKSNVLDAAAARIRRVFDEFDRVVVSVSSGKDSTVLYHLAINEARRRGRKVIAFFLDQEAEYEGSIQTMRKMMTDPSVIPWWYQVPINMTNATSYSAPFLEAWADGQQWMRPKEPNAITSIDGEYPRRFYEFFDWLERGQNEPTAFLVGLRSKESMNRFRAVTKNAGYRGIPWSTSSASPTAWRFYPIYDWTFGDVWKCIYDNNLPYNPVYDKMYCLKGMRLNDVRISNLIHEKSFTCLAELQEIEPETYERLCRRLEGVHAAAIYAREKSIYAADVLPDGFSTWKEYRDSLLASAPMSDKHRTSLAKRFSGQGDCDAIHRQQCRQVLLCDYENSLTVDTKAAGRAQRLRAKWWDVL